VSTPRRYESGKNSVKKITGVGTDPPLASHRGRGYTAVVLLPALVGLLLIAATPARAQSKIGLIDAAASASAPSASVGSMLSAPSAVPLLIAAPALSPSALASTAILAPLAPAPLAAPVAALAPLPATAVSATAPVFAAPARGAPAAQTEALPPALRAVAHVLDEAGPGGAASLNDDQLVALTQRLAGEGAPSDFNAAYLRPDRPFDFGEKQSKRYQAALKDYKSGRAEGAAEVGGLMDAARQLALSAGIEVVPVLRPSVNGGAANQGLRVLPLHDGSLLNRLAFDLDRRYGAVVEYVPERIAGGVAAYNSGAKVLFLPHFGRADSFEAVLHESAHAQFTARLERGDISPFHGQLIAYEGRAIAPGAASYVEHMSLEEIFTHGKQIKHQLAATRQAGSATPESLLPTYSFIYQYADVLRSARLNLALARSYVRDGRAKIAAADGEPEPFPGGRWYRVGLPYGWFYFPARTESSSPRSFLKRAFAPKPESGPERALRRRADSLLKAVAEIDSILVDIEAGIKTEAPDLAKLNADADRIVASLRRAEQSFTVPEKK
jgi:hypothetical protein